MNIDPDAARDHRLPDCHGDLAVDEVGERAGVHRAAAWPTRSATTSRCCWSTRPAGRAERQTAMVDLVRRVPARRRARAGRRRPARCARSPSPARGYAARPARPRPAIAEAVAGAREQARPRAVVAAGPDSRLLRAVLEPWCPVPFVAWPGPALPGWAGGLDLVVVLAPDGGDAGTASAVAEAVRRGCQVVVACPPALARRRARGRPLEHDPARPSTRDQLATAVVMLEYLDRVDLGPPADAEQVADALDDVAIACSPHRDLAVNPAKMLAIALADTNPAGLGRLGARGPGRTPGGRVDPPRQRPDGARRRRRAPAARPRGGPPARRVRRPVRRRPGERRPRAAWCSTTAPRTRWSASSAAGSRRRRPRTASASRPWTRTPPPRWRATPRSCCSGTYAAGVPRASASSRTDEPVLEPCLADDLRP